MTRSTLVLRYTAFAAMATLANLSIQRILLTTAIAEAMPGGTLLAWIGLGGDTGAYRVALFAGTVAGLMVKYVLDKRWIFMDYSQGIGAHGRRFPLYVLMGVATTAIFWSTETLSWMTWGTQSARELGAVLGLSVGYVVKYRLDRRFVFIGVEKWAKA